MDRLDLFPETTRIENDTLTIAGCSLSNLAEKYGTPLYLFDRATLDNSLKSYQESLEQFYPGLSGITYAGKAFLCLAIAEWTQQHSLWLDCAGQGEIAIALGAGVPRERLLVHGVNKSSADLEATCDHAGVLVVDNLTEMGHLVEISRHRNVPEIWIRFRPGLEVKTHTHIQTGQAGSKFGMDSTQVLDAARICRDHHLPVSGLHFHLGSQIRDPDPYLRGIELTLDLAAKIGFDGNWTLSPGGGWGVAYHEDELPQPDPGDLIRRMAETLVRGCKERQLALPRLQLEPGRSLVARSGVALYRVGTVKLAGDRVWALLDGGMADNPRPALYGARYSALPVQGPGRPAEGPLWFAGPYCESGDVLIEALPFPKVTEGDLVAVPVSGAYQLSMGSNYNGALHPAVLWLDQGREQVVREREKADDLMCRDHRLVKPNGKG
jgi:diaminopimelate decarboxylase